MRSSKAKRKTLRTALSIHRNVNSKLKSMIYAAFDDADLLEELVDGAEDGIAQLKDQSDTYHERIIELEDVLEQACDILGVLKRQLLPIAQSDPTAADLIVAIERIEDAQ